MPGARATTGPQGAQGANGAAGSQGAQGATGGGGYPGTGKFKSGMYYGAFAGGFATAQTARNRVDYVPFWVGTSTTFDRIGIHTGGSAGDAGTVLRFGIYSDDGTGYPGALVADYGTVVGTNANTDNSITISQALAAGLYWIATCVQGGSSLPQIRTGGGTSGINIGAGSGDTATGGSVTGYQESGQSGALPATAAAGMTGNYTNAAPYLRAA